MTKKKSLLIVDGYNILNAWDMIDSRINLEAAREDLAEILADFSGYIGDDITLVYDAHRTDTAGAEAHYGDLTVIYTKTTETADSYIERMIGPYLNTYRKISVATADYALQLFALGAGALRITPLELKTLVEKERGREIE